jgi:outer membrane protein assembly complex protein YaeT
VAALFLLTTPLATGAGEVAKLVGKSVTLVQLFREGVLNTDRSMLDLIETRVDQPLSIRQVRESVFHLFNLGKFTDVRVSATEDVRGVALRYDLVLLRTVAGVEFRGSLGRPPDELLDAITRRFGSVVRVDQIPDAVLLLESLYHASGWFAARIRPEMSASGQLAFVVEQGPRARLGRIEVEGVSEGDRGPLLARLGLEEGAVYDPVEVELRLDTYEADVRGRRYYDADFRHEVTPSADGRSVAMLLDIQTGSPVTILFEGDEVPDAPLAELVPVEKEGSIDEDLLEDSSLRVETHLRSLGYRDARVTYLRLADPGVLSVVFTVDRGDEFQVHEVRFEGHQALSVAELRELFGVMPRTPLVQTVVDQGGRAVAARYAQLGYRAAQLRSTTIEPTDTLSGVVPVSLAVEIVEGPRTMIGVVGFEGSTAFSAAQLGALVDVVPGIPYYGRRLAADADAVLAHYLNEGYETTQVEVVPRFDETGATADITFVVREGPQILVDHVLVVGNRQIASSAIRRELTLRPGDPLGQDEVDETRRRLTALGLFRRIELRQFSHGGGNRRDVVVVVDEAPATRIGYGGGLEVTQRLRATQAGAAAEQLELAPRGFFEIGRRNLWGRNRSIDLFTRVSLRRGDDLNTEVSQSNLGFSEYRVLLNYSEPRAFRQSGDLFIAGFIEQAIRPSFDLFSRGVSAELRRVLGLSMTASVGYTYGQNRVTNEQLQPEDRPLVDRLFPEVTLSSFSSVLVRDTRDDPLDTTSGSLLGVDGKVAFHAIGSAVGFAKTTLQGFLYRRLPGDLVFAAGVRLGLARGFSHTVDTGESISVPIEALPASERFFAGGDTTVRGFALDRLGDGATIDSNGFPTGGNAMVVLNSELRVPVAGPLQVVGFLDAGNIFDSVSHLRPSHIRGGAGFGVRYGSPVGPIRVDLGFKLDRRVFSGQRESLTALHLSIGQAF